MPTTRRNPWVSLDASADPVDVSRRLQLAHSTVVGHDGRVPSGVRPVVLDSWRRTTRAGLRPEGHAPTVVIDEARIDEVRREHPLAATLPAIHEAVGRVAHDAGHLLVVTDATGTLLWAEGHSAIKDAAWHLGFFEGARWSEELVGTNAIGTALAIDHPVQILSGEHFVRTHHPWVCSGAPIHDPEAGAQLGVIDLSGPLRTAHPMILGFVTTAARMAEHLLAERMHQRDRVLHEALLGSLGDRAGGRTAVVSPSGRVVGCYPPGWLTARIAAPPPDGGPVTLPDGTVAELHPVRDGAGFLVRTGAAASVAPRSRPGRAALTLLDGRPRIAWDGTTLELGARHAEILALLAAHPEGLTGEELTRALYGDGGNPVTVRAELSRLRRLLGPRVRTRPYRLAPEVDADLGTRLTGLRAGRSTEPLAGPLLPRSTAPGVVALRQALASDAPVSSGPAASVDRDALPAGPAPGRPCEPGRSRPDGRPQPPPRNGWHDRSVTRPGRSRTPDDHHDDGAVHEHDLGLAHDLPVLMSRRRVLGLLGVGAGAALVGCGTSGGGTTTTGAAGPSTAMGATPSTTTSTAVAALPEETAGPFPGDGSNGPNVLAESGVVRRDITRSIGDASGVAAGVPTTIELTLLDIAAGGTPLAGAAVYAWHCDREGRYSLYDGAIAGENYLRGVQESDARGRLSFRTIFPAAYPGRWPHVHFEVYESLEAATTGTAKLRTSQLALPQETCAAVYATAGYEQSAQTMAGTSLDADMVFSDGYASQLARATGTPDGGITLRLNVGV